LAVHEALLLNNLKTTENGWNESSKLPSSLNIKGRVLKAVGAVEMQFVML
jgi:hypothetical protein